MSSLRQLPSVDHLSRSPELAIFGPQTRIRAAKEAISSLRDELKAGLIPIENAIGRAVRLATAFESKSLAPAINASGIVLHTGLGRARLPRAAAEHVAMVAAGHSLVEIDLDEGTRGDRQAHVRGLLIELTGAEDAMVVNNCAAAVMLAISALCHGGEVILSRGQMVEIGGAFRMPEIVLEAGGDLVEVGCTNKTRLSDYEQAINENTTAILRCHPSNFRILGFTEQPNLEELAELADQYEIALIDDAGSGCLLDTTRFGLKREPTLRDSIEAGSGLVLASGDKLLGGPQAGLIVGREEYISTLRRHPMARAVRIDKLSLAALEATLRLYATGRELEIPVWSSVAKPMEEIKRAAQRLGRSWPGKAAVEQGLTEVGGGSMPGNDLPTWRVGLETEQPDQLAKILRLGHPAIISRIESGRVWLDPRTMASDEVGIVAKRLGSLGAEWAETQRTG